MHFVERVQVQSTRQRKIPVPKKFWREFALDSVVKIELMNNSGVFFVDFVQAQGGVQRRIPVPQKFWDFFSAGCMVMVTLMHTPTILSRIVSRIGLHEEERTEKEGTEKERINEERKRKAEYVDLIRVQSARQRKIPVPKKFWGDFTLGSVVKIGLVDDPTLFFVDMVQAQGKIQRRIGVPEKFWKYFEKNSFVIVQRMDEMNTI